MTETVQEALTPKPLSPEDVHKLIGALYLEIDFLRRQVLQLRAYIETNGQPREPDPAA